MTHNIIYMYTQSMYNAHSYTGHLYHAPAHTVTVSVSVCTNTHMQYIFTHSLSPPPPYLHTPCRGSVKHTGSFSQITSRPLTPRSPTCSSSHGGGTGGGGGGGGGYQDSPFLKPRFDTSSDSEAGDSETTTSYPRYTYKLSPSPSNKEVCYSSEGE